MRRALDAALNYGYRLFGKDNQGRVTMVEHGNHGNHGRAIDHGNHGNHGNHA